MEMTQQDYDERVARSARGDATDEDRRLIKLYDNAGFKPTQGKVRDGEEDGGEHEVTPVAPAPAAPEGDDKGGDRSSDGNSTANSADRAPKTEPKTTVSPQSSARTTGNRSTSEKTV